MQKVISINLNGNAYQLEEGGYDALSEYLARCGSGAQGQPGSGRNHGRSRAGDRRQVPAVSRLAQVGGHRRRSGADHRGDGPGHRGTGGGHWRAERRRRSETGGRRRRRDRAAAEAPLPHPRRRDDRGRLQRPRRVLPDRRHPRSHRLRRPRAADERRRHSHLRRDDVPGPRSEHTGGTRSGRRHAVQREGSGRSGEAGVRERQQALDSRVAAEAAAVAPGRLVGRGRCRLHRGSPRSCRCSGSCT